MFIVVAPIQIKHGFRQQFVQEIIADAQGSVTHEPGCLRFDVVQDSNDPDRVWLYEVYKDEDAFQQHLAMPHFERWRDATKEWIEEGPVKAVIGGSNIWPSDEDWT